MVGKNSKINNRCGEAYQKPESTLTKLNSRLNKHQDNKILLHNQKRFEKKINFWNASFSPKFELFSCLMKNLIYAATSSNGKIVSSSLYLGSVGIRGALNKTLACTGGFVFPINQNILYLFLMYTTAVYFKIMQLVLL